MIMSPVQRAPQPSAPSRPMQHGAAGEVTAAADQGDARGDAPGCAPSQKRMRGGRRRMTHCAVGGVEIDRHAAEGAAPLDHRARRSADARWRSRRRRRAPGPPRPSRRPPGERQSQRKPPAGCGCAARAGRWRTSARCRSRGGPGPPGSTRFRWVAAQLVERGPELPLPADVLPLLGADDAVLRRERLVGVLRAAGDADEVRHARKSKRGRRSGSSGLSDLLAPISACRRPPAVLSVRQRAIRGKRTAMPDLCRVERWMPSKASSKTSSGLTVRTGPNFSSVLRRTKASTLRISSSVRPEYALANGTSRSPSQTPKV